MRVMWCWRCRLDVPMLDDDEWAVVHEIYVRCLIYAKHEGRESLIEQAAGLETDDQKYALLDDMFYRSMQPVREAYEKITGFKNMNEDAIRHHRISLYGPPCKRCGKPLRTPQAAFCAACGQVVEIES